jgi:hypothetical protein
VKRLFLTDTVALTTNSIRLATLVASIIPTSAHVLTLIQAGATKTKPIAVSLPAFNCDPFSDDWVTLEALVRIRFSAAQWCKEERQPTVVLEFRTKGYKYERVSPSSVIAWHEKMRKCNDGILDDWTEVVEFTLDPEHYAEVLPDAIACLFTELRTRFRIDD